MADKTKEAKNGMLITIQLIFNPHKDKWIAEIYDHQRKVTYEARGRYPEKAVKRLFRALKDAGYRWDKQAPYAGRLTSGITESGGRNIVVDSGRMQFQEYARSERNSCKQGTLANRLVSDVIEKNSDKPIVESDFASIEPRIPADMTT